MASLYRARVSTCGRITIPVELRRRFGIQPGDEIIFVEREGYIFMILANRRPEDLRSELGSEAPDVQSGDIK